MYDKDGLEFIPTAEGRVLPPQRAINPVDGVKNAFWRYEYQLKDHLGNLRVACRCAEKPTATSVSDAYAPVVVQENHYDAWGLSLPLNPESEKVGGNPADRFTYNSKERQEGLGWLDYGARMYDPARGGWNSVDPLAEVSRRWSPYTYVYNNPLRFVDPDGMEAGSVNDPYSHISAEDRALIYSDEDPPAKRSGSQMSSARSDQASGSQNYEGRTEQNPNGDAYSLDGMNNPLAAVQATMGLYDIVGIGAMIRGAGVLYQGLVKGLAGGLKWTLTKAGYKFAAKGITNAGEMLGDFGIPKFYTYTSGGKSVFVAPHTMKHLEELERNAIKLGPDYKKLLGQTHLKALNAALDDILSRGTINYRQMYYSGGNEIMFEAPRNVSQLPAVIHFR